MHSPFRGKGRKGKPAATADPSTGLSKAAPGGGRGGRRGGAAALGHLERESRGRAASPGGQVGSEVSGRDGQLGGSGSPGGWAGPGGCGGQRWRQGPSGGREEAGGSGRSHRSPDRWLPLTNGSCSFRTMET